MRQSVPRTRHDYPGQSRLRACHQGNEKVSGPHRPFKRYKTVVSAGGTCLLALFFVGCRGTTSSTSTSQTPTSPTAAPPEPADLYTSTAGTLGHTTLEPASMPGFKSLVNATGGYRLTFPDDWQLRGQVVATEFAEGAECQSVETIDYQPPEGSTALILHSLVQICAQPLTDALTLEQFMIRSYGALLGEQFETMDFSGQSAYHTRAEGPDATVFLQTQKHRIQIVSAVAAEPDLYPAREAQVVAILRSITFAS